MIHQLGSPHLFFTLSAADLHWPDLHRIIEHQKAIATGTEPFDLSSLDEKERFGNGEAVPVEAKRKTMGQAEERCCRVN